MAAREASLKITLQPASFQAGLRRMEGMTARSGKKMGAALKGPMSAGLKSAKSELSGMVSGLKNGIKMAATLGGALSFAGFAKDAVKMQNTYRNIAFNVNKVAGNAVKWNDIQSMVTDSVKRTGRNADELAEAFMTVFEATGDMVFAKQSMDIVGTTATATGHSISALGTTMQLAFRKFGVGGDQAEEAMARMIEKTGVGGKGIEELTSRFALVAGEAANAGMTGAAGISELLGMMLLLDSSIGEKADPGLKMMFQTVKGGSSQFVALKKAMGRGVEFKADMSAMDKIKATLQSAGGRKSAETIFTADARVVYDELAKPFDQAMEEAKSRGMKKSDALNFALAAFDENIRKASESSMEFSTIQDEAARRVETDPMVKFNLAVARLREAFVQPKMIAAFDKLADKMPAFADALANIITHIVDNPWGSLATLVGGKLALAFGGSMISGIIAKGMAGLFAQMAAVQAASGAASVATGGATSLGVGGAVGAAGGGGAAVATGAVVAGAVLAAGGAGGAVGYGVHKATDVEGQQAVEAQSIRDAAQAVSEAGLAGKGGDAAQIKQALRTLATSKQAMETKKVGGAYGLLDSLAAVVTGGQSQSEQRETRTAEITAEQVRLKKALATLTAGAGDLGKAMKVATGATGQFGAATTTRGPLNPASPQPGSDPRGG